MKNEMIKFVEDNFEVIHIQFLKDELEILNDCCGDDIVELNRLKEFLLDQIKVESAEELIDVINERSIGVDLDGNEVIKLFNMIKGIINLK